MVMLETPSRIWRRIEAVEGRDMPSLPSLPGFDSSAESNRITEDEEQQQLNQISEELNQDDSLPIHSTPASSHMHTAASTIRMPSSTSSTARFATSIASRSASGKSASGISGNSTRRIQSRYDYGHESFDVSEIPSVPHDRDDGGMLEGAGLSRDEIEQSTESVPEVYLPPEDEENEAEDPRNYDDSLTGKRENAPSPSPSAKQELDNEATPKKAYDYSVSLRSEPRPSPLSDKYRNVAFRKPLARVRTPSLTRTISSSASSTSSNSTPHSSRSHPPPLSTTSSPVPVSSIPHSRPAAVLPVVVVQRPDEGDTMEELATAREEELSSRAADEHSFEGHPQDATQRQETHSGEIREPTFSTDEGTSPPHSNNRSATLSVAFSSPAPSVTFTPTPVFRPRLNVPTPNNLTSYSQRATEFEQDDDPLVTPHTRRRSFLMDVINSARPRMKYPTPHPRHSDVTPGHSSASNKKPRQSDVVTFPGTQLQNAFAGITPRPRLSHPLAQTYIPSTPASEEASDSGGEGSIQGQAQLRPWSPQTQSQSPYESDRASFISTASSHDLTTRHRANTSFDPVMGLGGHGGHGVGRFNAGKLNAYLHGLNRRLQEENEQLVDRLRRVEEEKRVVGSANESVSVMGNVDASGGGRRTSAGRRVSAGCSGLGDVKEEEEDWAKEKAELEEVIEMLRKEMDLYLGEKEEVELELEKERSERMRDKERWKERMGEVEKGVESIVKELEKKVGESEKKAKAAEQDRVHAEKRVIEIEGERDAAMERAAKAEIVLERGTELGGDLREANERVGKIMGDLRNANKQIRELETEVMRSDGRVDELEAQLRESGSVENEMRTQIASMEDDAKKVDEEFRITKNYVADLEEDAGAAVERIEYLEEQLASALERIESLGISEQCVKEKADRLEADGERASDLARQMEEALEAAESKMKADEEELVELKGRIGSLERAREHSKSHQGLSGAHRVSGPTDAELEELEEELDGANREIARLTTLLQQSPSRKAIEKAKDTRIEILEKDKEALMERIKALRTTEVGTPSKIVNASGISPIHRQVLSMSVRAPRTPGVPLRDMSWLNNTSADPNVSPLVAEISRLQRELDRANESIDDKLDKLEDAGLGVVGLTSKLEDARSRITALEEEIARLSRREDRRLRRLERARCRKCNIKLDLKGLTAFDVGDESSQGMLPSEPPTPPTRTTETLRANLHSMNTNLETMKTQWEEEKRKLLGEKAVLQDAAKRLNLEIRTVKHEVKRAAETERASERLKAGNHGELEKAKCVIADLEAELKGERSRLRALSTDQSKVQREKETILVQLKRTESDMDDVKRQLQKVKHENHDLEAELRVNANADQKARLLEIRVAENTETIDQLRQERSLLVADHKDLQHRFSDLSDLADRLRNERAASQTSHNNRRHQLDLHLGEIDELRRALSDQADDLHQAEEEKNRIVADRGDVARTVAALEADLKRVKRDAQAFGRDLKLLRAEKEKLEDKRKDGESKAQRARKQAETQIRLLSEQLASQQESARSAREELDSHVCILDERKLSAIIIQHKDECKGLMVQMHYLKAKFTREASLRCDLGYQKHFLLVQLAKFERSEQRVLASVIRTGFSAPPARSPKKRRSLKSIVWSILFILRARLASDLWREQCEFKPAMVSALHDTRRRRAAVS